MYCISPSEASQIQVPPHAAPASLRLVGLRHAGARRLLRSSQVREEHALLGLVPLRCHGAGHAAHVASVGAHDAAAAAAAGGAQ